MDQKPLNSQSAPVFTVARIAEAWGLKRPAVYYYLELIPPAVQVGVRGTGAGAWRYDQFPPALREKGDRIAVAQGARSGQQLLLRQARRWQPAIPMPELHPDCIEQAVKLQRALAPSLARKNDPSLNQQERATLGIKEYAREFGHSISQRHWWNLYDRTLERDSGAGNWARLEIYLPNNLKRKTAGVTLATQHNEFSSLYDIIAAFTNPAAPESDEKAELWRKTFQFFDREIENGAQAKKLRLKLIAFLWQSCPALAKSQNALRVAFDARLERYRAADGKAESQADGREETRGVPKAAPYDPEQIQMIEFHGGENCGGRVSQAVRECIEKGKITDPRILSTEATSKTYVKRSLRRAVADTASMHRQRLGRRATDKDTPPLELEYSGIYSMDCVVGDDFTWPVKFMIPDGKGWWRLIRGQDILLADFRTLRILSCGLRPSEQYNSQQVCTVLQMAFEEHGIPKMIYREGGLWRRSKLINSLLSSIPNAEDVAFSDVQRSYRLARAGVEVHGESQGALAALAALRVQFREAYRARSKPIERVGGLLQDYMDGLRGYCGRNERVDCPAETLKWERELYAKNPEALGYFMDFSQWEEKRHQIIEQFNATKQEGKRLRDPLTGEGLSPDQAFEIFWPHHDKPAKFGPESRWLLAHRRIDGLRRTKYGISFELNGETFRYCDEQTGALKDGEKLVGWFNPDLPEVCTFTDRNLQNPFSVERLMPVNALHIDDNFRDQVAKVQAHAGVKRAKYRALKAKFAQTFRQNVVSAITVDLGAHVEGQESKIRQQQKVREKNLQRAGKLDSELNIAQPARAIGSKTDPDNARILRNFMAGKKENKP